MIYYLTDRHSAHTHGSDEHTHTEDETLACLPPSSPNI